MSNKHNVNREFDLYEPMKFWLYNYISDKYKGYEVVSIDSHAERLDRVLLKFGILNDIAIGLDIQIDILGIAKLNTNVKLFFIEAKKSSLTIRDLGQLWVYCKLVEPEEAFLLTSANLGSLSKLLQSFKREDLLDFGNGRIIKKIKVGVWNILANSPEQQSLIPKI